MEITRLHKLHKVLYKHKYYLHNLDKIKNVCFDISEDDEDITLTFNSRYGDALIVICKDYMFYEGPKRNFTSSEELDYYQQNALRELELYIFNIYKVPCCFSEKVKYYIRGIYDRFRKKIILFNPRTR